MSDRASWAAGFNERVAGHLSDRLADPDVPAEHVEKLAAAYRAEMRVYERADDGENHE